MDRLERLASFLLDPSRDEPPPLCNNKSTEEPVEEKVIPQNFAFPLCKKRRVAKVEGIASCMVEGMQASCNAWRWKVAQCDSSLLSIPNLHSVMDRLNANPSSSCFDLRLPKAKLASAVLKHCVALISGVAARGAHFKIGITSDPGFRWFNPSFGYAYAAEIFTTMVMIAIVRSMEAAAFLEAALIREFRGHKLCLNEALGGEGVAMDASPGFVYLVHTCFEPCS